MHAGLCLAVCVFSSIHQVFFKTALFRATNFQQTICRERCVPLLPFVCRGKDRIASKRCMVSAFPLSQSVVMKLSLFLFFCLVASFFGDARAFNLKRKPNFLPPPSPVVSRFPFHSDASRRASSVCTISKWLTSELKSRSLQSPGMECS